jgi:prepilin-type N-terminal cleavage/methylation domain-containing protein
MKKGFGLLEVLLAAVVLGFLMVGLNKLQMANREAILRVRARDAANFIAQQVLDSIGSLGINSIQKKVDCGGNLVYCKDKYTYNFENTSIGISTPIDYKVEVELLSNTQSSEERTNLTKADNTIPTTNTYAKNLQATVEWEFKKTKQSIQMAKVVR